MTTSAPCRTFRNPSSATLAHLGGRPIAVKWDAAPDEGALTIPSDVDLATSYDGVTLDDGRIILTPTGTPFERGDTRAEPSAKKAAKAGKRARGTSAAGVSKARGAAATRGRSQPAPSRTVKKSANRPRNRS
jgi:hypothetical protein